MTAWGQLLAGLSHGKRADKKGRRGAPALRCDNAKLDQWWPQTSTVA